MRFKGCVFLLMILSIAWMGTVQAAASEIVLDGEFSDWADKPGLEDVQGDETLFKDFVMVRWFPDPSDSMLYLYCERADCRYDQGYGREYWDFNVDFSSVTGERRANISYHSPSRMVDVRLVDNSGGYLWSAKGRWGDDKYEARRVEFKVPLSLLVGWVNSGYELDMIFLSGEDRVPDDGVITISTIGTSPWVNAGALALTAIAGIELYKRKNNKSARGV